MKIYFTLLASCVLSLFTTSILHAQAPTFELTNNNVCLDAAFEVPVKVSDFNEVTSFQFTVQWDMSIMEIDTIGFANDALGLTLVFGDFSEDNAILTVSWYDGAVNGVTLDDDETIFTLLFNAVGSNGSMSDVTFENTPTSKEVSAIVDNDITIVTSTYVEAMTAIAQPELANVEITNDVDNANVGAVDITVATGTAPYSYVWGDGITTEDLSGLGMGMYSCTVTDSKSCVTDLGSFTVENTVNTREIGSLENIMLHPNPSKNNTTLNANFTQVEEVEVILFDILGQKVFSELVEDATIEMELNLEGLSAGQYFVQLRTKDGIHTEKLEVIR